MKEFDQHWSTDGYQLMYESIVLKEIEKDIKILGNHLNHWALKNIVLLKVKILKIKSKMQKEKILNILMKIIA